jgi:hypothetical protein
MPGKEDDAGKKAMKLGDCLMIVRRDGTREIVSYQWVRPGIILDSISF